MYSFGDQGHVTHPILSYSPKHMYLLCTGCTWCADCTKSMLLERAKFKPMKLGTMIRSKYFIASFATEGLLLRPLQSSVCTPCHLHALCLGPRESMDSPGCQQGWNQEVHQSSPPSYGPNVGIWKVVSASISLRNNTNHLSALSAQQVGYQSSHGTVIGTPGIWKTLHGKNYVN
jgi:hypothetical protein